MKIQESAENYLETVLILQERTGSVRSIDIVNELGFSKPSVSIYIRNLRDNGYIDIDSKGFISLTEAGKAIAVRTYERHLTIKTLLIGLGVSSEVAETDACRIEHVISKESFDAIKNHVALYQKTK